MSTTSTPTPTRTEGHLRLRAARVNGRSRLVELECHAPLQLLRAHHLDAALPEMAQATIVSPSGGVLQGDRLEITVEVGSGARLRLDTPSAMRLYRMPDATAEQRVWLRVEDDGYLEFLPEPTVPYAGSNFAATTHCEVDEGATLILGEAVSAGRAARGEVHQFARFASVVEIGRPGGPPLAVDATILDPADGLARPGRLGGYAALGTLYVVRRGFEPDLLRATAASCLPPTTISGASRLPNGLGAWLKVLGPDGPSVARVLAAASGAAHQEILGAPPPGSRRP